MEKNTKKDVNTYPGVDTNASNGNKVSPKMVKDEIKELNNNPRVTDIDMP